MDTDAGSGQARHALSAIAGKHAALASYTFFGISDRKSHKAFSITSIAPASEWGGASMCLSQWGKG
jgi:hypothetical protein